MENKKQKGIVTEDAIRIKLHQTIKKQLFDLEWYGIDMNMVENIDHIEACLENGFRYEGSGEYMFSAYISFMVKIKNNEDEMHRESYRISPPAKIVIKETENDFNIEIVSPISLQKK